jgi:hypothetical protein
MSIVFSLMRFWRRTPHNIVFTAPPINLVCNFEQTRAETLRILAGSSIQTGASGQTVSPLEGKIEVMVGVAQDKVDGNGQLTDEKATKITHRMPVNPVAWMTRW